MKTQLRIVIGIVMLLLLFAVRAFEMNLFYDPLIDYFQNDYLYKRLPNVNAKKLLIDLLFRYGLNTILSLGIIYVAFLNKAYLKFSIYFYAIAFVVLIVAFSLLLFTNLETGYLLPFYVRRFLVHPIFILILLPVFYYQKKWFTIVFCFLDCNFARVNEVTKN